MELVTVCVRAREVKSEREKRELIGLLALLCPKRANMLVIRVRG